MESIVQIKDWLRRLEKDNYDLQGGLLVQIMNEMREIIENSKKEKNWN